MTPIIRYKRTHRITRETKYGYFSELADLDVRLWTRAVPIETPPAPRVALLSEEQTPTARVTTSALINIRKIHQIMTRKAAYQRICERNDAHFTCNITTQDRV